MYEDKLAHLPLQVEGYVLDPRKLSTSAGWLRRTTVVRLRGGGVEGRGEDVTYDGDNQLVFQKRADLPVAGTYTLAEFSQHLDGLELFTDEPTDPAARHFRRWAFESAALDLALRQAGTNLAELLGRTPAPLSYVVSLGLGEPASTAPLEKLLALYPDARFKIDLSESWTAELVDQLAGLGRVTVVDLKGHYRGAFKGPAASAEAYGWVAQRLPDVWIEDPWLDEDTRPALRAHETRITWDATLHSLDDLLRTTPQPRCINIKPSRFGRVSELMRVYAHCEQHGIAMYGGGQFELDVGRGQIQELASLFHADAANDVAPSAFNDENLRGDLPASPLAPPAATPGFGW